MDNILDMKIIFSDLDGTLLNNQQQVSAEDLRTLKRLGRHNVIRVIATGRSYFSLQKVLPPDFPLDYIILSSGVGIMNWKTKALIRKYEIPSNLVQELSHFLIDQKVDFMVHAALPDNHWFQFFHHNHHNIDFKQRLQLYAPFASPIEEIKNLPAASQFVLIFARADSFSAEIRSALNGVNIIRATSPLDHASVWFELLPAQASKQQAAQFLCRQFKLTAADALALGNDYNDRDLLDWAGRKFVVANAPQVLKTHFPVTVSNNENPLTQILENYEF